MVEAPESWPMPSGMAPAFDDIPRDDPKHDADARKELLMTIAAASIRELAYSDADNVESIKRAAAQL